MNRKEISQMRRDYQMHHLDSKEVKENPIDQFSEWFDEVAKTPIAEVNAMNLSSVGKDGKVSSRMVLLKSFDRDGFVFYTNYRSYKSQQMEENPYACINFFWYTKERQVTIEGYVEKVSDAESDEYFSSRPRGSQIAAHVSHHQSAEVEGREELSNKYEEMVKKFEGKEISRPDYWGGYLLKPVKFEFWQGRPFRLHDRIEFIKSEEGNWSNRRLMP